jgi:hypothetical protein
MSKKMNKLVLLSALMIAIIGTFGTVSAEEFELIADGGNDTTAFPVGMVDVTYDGNNLYVTYSITEVGWEMTETHLHVATDESPIPLTKKGNPKVGKFDNSTEYESCVTEYTYVIPFIAVPGTEVIIAAHAAVQMEVVDTLGEITTFEESAWGEGEEDEEFDGRNWAMYFTYTIEEPEPE